MSTVDYRSKADRQTIVQCRWQWVHFVIIDERWECLRNSVDDVIPYTGTEFDHFVHLDSPLTDLVVTVGTCQFLSYGGEQYDRQGT